MEGAVVLTQLRQARECLEGLLPEDLAADQRLLVRLANLRVGLALAEVKEIIRILDAETDLKAARIKIQAILGIIITEAIEQG
jgi:hypothetical protein